jgi:hypothetical protein
VSAPAELLPLLAKIDVLEKAVLHLQGHLIDMQQRDFHRANEMFQLQRDVNTLLERTGIPK